MHRYLKHGNPDTLNKTLAMAATIIAPANNTGRRSTTKITRAFTYTTFSRCIDFLPWLAARRRWLHTQAYALQLRAQNSREQQLSSRRSPAPIVVSMYSSTTRDVFQADALKEGWCI